MLNTQFCKLSFLIILELFPYQVVEFPCFFNGWEVFHVMDAAQLSQSTLKSI